jgi:tetratricopeptide (TPR) repeat protein
MKPGSALAIVVFGLTLSLSAAACSKDIDPDQALREGLTQQQAGNMDAAATKYQEVLDVRPGDQYANYNLGVIEQADGRTQLAEGYYRAALDAAPSFVPALFNLAIIRTRVGATQEAIDLYQRVLQVQPDDAAAHLNLGLLYRDSNQPKLAQRHLNRAIQLDPSLADRITLEPAPGVSATPKPSSSASP